MVEIRKNNEAGDMNMLQKFLTFKKTKIGAAITTVVALLLVYLFGSLAIDTASMLIYAVAFAFVYVAVTSFFDIFSTQKTTTNAKKRHSKKTA